MRLAFSRVVVTLFSGSAVQRFSAAARAVLTVPAAQRSMVACGDRGGRGRPMTSPTLDPGLDDLRTRVSGTVTGPGDPGYDEARAIWNGMIDRRPAAVARAAGTDDVAPPSASPGS